MASPDEPRAGVEAYFVLKQGGMHGPFTRAELEARLANGIVSMEDFVQVEGVPIWRPLARVLGGAAGAVEETGGAIAPDWRSIVTWAWLRLRYDLDQESVVSGWVCLAIGLIALSCANFTVIFWLPWVIASLVAALALWQRRRFVHGAALLAAAILLPLGIFALQGPKRPPSDSTPTESNAQPASEPTPAQVPIPQVPPALERGPASPTPN